MKLVFLFAVFVFLAANTVPAAKAADLSRATLRQVVRDLLIREGDGSDEEPEYEEESARGMNEDDAIELEEQNGEGLSAVSPSQEYRELMEEKRGSQARYTYTCYKDGTSKEEYVKRSSLFAHNFFRKLTGAPDLEWDEDLAKKAQDHANFMAKYRRLIHTSALTYGENIASKGLSAKPTLFGPASLVKQWWEEINDYDFNANKMGQSGHFTQVVWKGTKKLGCGLALSDEGKMVKTYLCCQYTPAGNVDDQFTANVGKPADMRKYSIAEADPDGACDYFKNCNKFKRLCSKIGAACAKTCNK